MWAKDNVCHIVVQAKMFVKKESSSVSLTFNAMLHHLMQHCIKSNK